MQYVPLGQIARFLFSVQNKAGSLTVPDVQGSIALHLNGAAQANPGEAVTIVDGEFDGDFVAEVDTSDASMQASGEFAVGVVITAEISGIEVDGVSDVGGWFADSIRIISELSIPTSPDYCVCWFVALSPDGEPIEGAEFRVALVEGDDEPGFAKDTTPRDLISGPGGLVQFQALRLNRYSVWAGNSRGCAKQFDVPDADTFPVPEFLGAA